MMFPNWTYLSETNDLSFAEHIRFRRHEIQLQKFSTRWLTENNNRSQDSLKYSWVTYQTVEKLGKPSFHHECWQTTERTTTLSALPSMFGQSLAHQGRQVLPPTHQGTKLSKSQKWNLSKKCLRFVKKISPPPPSRIVLSFCSML